MRKAAADGVPVATMTPLSSLSQYLLEGFKAAGSLTPLTEKLGAKLSKISAPPESSVSSGPCVWRVFIREYIWGQLC